LASHALQEEIVKEDGELESAVKKGPCKLQHMSMLADVRNILPPFSFCYPCLVQVASTEGVHFTEQVDMVVLKAASTMNVLGVKYDKRDC
jgi:hypothetical protein